MLFEKFGRGINLGGYLSQYEIVTNMKDETDISRHFSEFITEKDLQRIASWGLDHVRVPLDGFLFFDRKSGKLKEKPMGYLDHVIEWSERHGLNVILDLHNFWGHRFGQMKEPTELMTDDEIRSDFCLFWKKMAVHYLGFTGTTLLFELFNEIADATGYQWNNLYLSAIKTIREVDRERWILVGTNNVNSIAYLDRLALSEDPYVFYNFHYYEPNCFSHQKAHFSEEMSAWAHALTYPGNMEDYLAFLNEHPVWKDEHELLGPDCRVNDHALMLRYLKYAENFLRYTGKELMCTEYGVIDSADEDEAVKWLKDFDSDCCRLHIGHTMWNYKELDFEVVNEANEIVRPKVLAYLCSTK